MFLKYPEVDMNLFTKFEEQVINANIGCTDRFVDAFSNYDFDEMDKIHDEFIEEVIEISEKYTS